MRNPVVVKLEHFTRLSAEDKAALDRIASARPHRINPREDIVQEGQQPNCAHIILKGWAYRYKQLEDGRRQIVGFLLPGDLCDNNIFVLKEMDHSMAALTSVTLAQVSRQVIDDLMLRHPRLTQAFSWEMLVNMAIQREWTVNVGQRTAFERIAHLFCELFFRMRAAGLTRGQALSLPVKQSDLADAAGLSTVHVNRTLQDLRALGLISLREKTLTIPDLDALMRAGVFNPNYLHLGLEGQHLDANR
jgi:CRP-like cAMP-binding protein